MITFGKAITEQLRASLNLRSVCVPRVSDSLAHSSPRHVHWRAQTLANAREQRVRQAVPFLFHFLQLHEALRSSPSYHTGSLWPLHDPRLGPWIAQLDCRTIELLLLFVQSPARLPVLILLPTVTLSSHRHMDYICHLRL